MGGGIMINKILKKIFVPDVAGWIGRTGVYPALAFASPPVTKPVAPTTRAWTLYKFQRKMINVSNQINC